MSVKAYTLNQALKITGTAIHNGRESTVRLIPAEKLQGIIFEDGEGNRLQVSPENLYMNMNLGTLLKEKKMEVFVTEHLLAALASFGIYHATIQTSQPELPILKGNSLDFVRRIKRIGYRPLKGKQRVITIKQKIRVQHGPAFIEATPWPRLELHGIVSYEKTPIGVQSMSFVEGQDSFEKELAWARTFGPIKELARLRRKGLSKGASLSNAIGYDEKKFYSQPKPKPNEFIRHKLLDLYGDLAVLGAPLRAQIVAFMPGHALNAKFVQKVLQSFNG